MWQRFREDAARWVVPEQVVDVSRVTPKLLAVLLWRHPPLRAMGWLRFASWAQGAGVRGLPLMIQHRLLKRYGLEINPRDEIEGGLYIAHPVGVVIKTESIGRNVTIVAAVTVGARNVARWPRLGEGVYVGTGARIIGDIDVGAHSRIGANAVVMSDVPPGAVAVGIPARVLPARVSRLPSTPDPRPTELVSRMAAAL